MDRWLVDWSDRMSDPGLDERIAFAYIGDLQDSIILSGQASGQAGDGPHKRGIHPRAGIQVHHQTLLASGDPLHAEGFHCRTVQERAFPVTANPTESIKDSDKNWAVRSHR